MGTPHAGSDYADWGSFLVKIIKLFQKTNTMLDSLRSRGSERQELENRFIQLLAGRETTEKIEARCFCETLSVSALGGKIGLGLVCLAVTVRLPEQSVLIICLGSAEQVRSTAGVRKLHQRGRRPCKDDKVCEF